MEIGAPASAGTPLPMADGGVSAGAEKWLDPDFEDRGGSQCPAASLAHLRQ